jgi:cob(I)alamin adenosyltransferase
MNRIYTKTGDKGTTSLFDGTRVDKDDIRVDTYGTIDELNSNIGVVVAHLLDTVYEEPLKSELLQIQDDLFTIGALLADPKEPMTNEFRAHLAPRVKEFEKMIDRLTEEMPELKNFVLPGGGKAGAFLQMTRTIARRAERRVISLFKKEEPKTDIVMYFNRLSDLFFTMSRYINFKEGNKETIWPSDA